MGEDCMWVFVSTFLATWFGLMVFDIRFLSRRKWVGLTDEEIKTIVNDNTSNSNGFEIWCNGAGVARAIQAKLKEKNGG